MKDTDTKIMSIVPAIIDKDGLAGNRARLRAKAIRYLNVYQPKVGDIVRPKGFHGPLSNIESIVLRLIEKKPVCTYDKLYMVPACFHYADIEVGFYDKDGDFLVVVADSSYMELVEPSAATGESNDSNSLEK